MLKDDQIAALNALNKVLVLARMMAYENSPGSDLAAVLDVAEYLVVLLADPADKTVEYRQQLKGLAIKYPQFQYPLDWFDRPPQW